MERMSTPELGAELLPAGSQIGRWRVVRCAGQGMYSTVYRVERAEPADTRPFALKLLSYPIDPRFEREVELRRRIHHGHVPRLHEVGWWKHGSGVLLPYFVMDWVQGTPLYPWAAARRVSSREVLRLLGQVARALEATHAVGAVHRDVKGANVLVRAEDSAAVLVDFGAGTFQGAAPLTRQALPPGTPPYRSPEALRFYVRWHPESGAPYEAKPADDLYALGVMTYRLVTGMYPPPHVRVELAEREEDDTPKWAPPEQLVTVSPQLAALIKQVLSVEPSARGSARQVAEAAERAARTAGKKADVPITLRSAQAAPLRLRWARALRPVLARSAWLAAGAVAGMALALGVTPRAPEVRNLGGQQVTQEDADGDTAGLADEEFLELGTEAKPAGETKGIGLEMPKEPFPGQLLAPCKDELEEEIRGGCWVALRKKPPCGKKSYEWQGACYWPSFPAKRPETSGKP
jgi:hypothetical protein